MARLFGTDGVRGKANKELTPELAFRLGKAGAYILGKTQKKTRIIIGKDTRISGDMLEAALTAGICSMGADVLRVGVLPTPAIAYLTKSMEGSAGVVISASHNPFEDNGIKFFDSSGYKLPDELEDKIEEALSYINTVDTPSAGAVGRVIEVPDASSRYINFLKKTAVKLDGLKVVVDCANGSAFQVGPRVLEELGAQVIPLADRPDGLNINVECGSTHPEVLARAVLKEGADIGLAFDGDADRVIAVDEKGNIIDGDYIMFICALALKEKERLVHDTLVVTIMSNMGLHKALKDAGIRVCQTKVGDRYVMEKLLETGSVLGGEQSGHIIFLEHTTTGDGLLSSLQLLSILQEKKAKLSQLASGMSRFPQVLVNVRVKNKEKILSSSEVKQKITEIENYLGDEGRILVRPSGTEPLIRVMLEGRREDELHALAGQMTEVVKSLDGK